MLAKCVICRHLRGSICQQKMTDLPRERFSQEPPFTYCGTDMCGSILVKEGRKKMKRYGFLFTCLSNRANHIESKNSLSPDAFIQALCGLYQEKVMFQSSELIMAQTLLEPVQNWTKYFQWWITRKSMSLCWTMVINGCSGKGILLLLALWEECVIAKKDLYVQSW